MTGPLVFALAMAAVLIFGVAMFWQESKRMRQPAAIYGVDDSVEYVWESLGEGKLGLKKSDVRRILEWEMHYLQQPDIWKADGAPVVGGEAAAAYAQDQALAHGYPYEPGQIYAVLDLQASYLEAIGAVGAPVKSGEADDILDGSDT